VLAAELPDPTGYGRILRDAEGRVSAIVEHKDATSDERQVRLVNTGVIAAEATALKRWLERVSNDNAQGEYYLTDVFREAAAEFSAAEIVIATDPIETEGANDPWQLAQLERAYQLRMARALCGEGVRFSDPARVDFRGEVTVGHDVEIDVDVIFEGRVTLGDGVRIGPFCRLKNVALAAGTEVRAHCDLEGARTEGAVTIGPFARLRPGTVLADGVHIGNFVETKNAKLGVGSKANHLHLPRRCGDRCGGEHRRRHHHLQLRRREQVDHDDRRRRLHRFEQRARGAGGDRQGRDDRCGLGDRQGCAGREAHARAREADDARRLAAPGQEEISVSRESSSPRTTRRPGD
jgi:UDP-N-acetylglucosamine diphosphorylase/glucosamine-1-phosphate N-acetyltransferase